MAVEYRKNKNVDLFKDFSRQLEVQHAQNYIPIYGRFFTLNQTNWNHVTLDHKWTLAAVNEAKGTGFHCTVREGESTRSADVFFKFSPLIDASKYLCGSHAEYDFSLPNLESSPHKKMADVNNAAYIDSFFYYLTSRALHEHEFIHGLDFFGSYLGIKNGFKFNMEDDAHFILNSTFFKTNKDSLFSVNVDITDEGLSRRNRGRLELTDADVELEVEVLDAGEPVVLDVEVIEPIEDGTEDCPEEEADKSVDGSISAKVSRCSSESSNTDEEVLSEEGETESWDSESMSDDVIASINQFPVQVIALEACVETLDSVLEKIKPEELTSALMQVVMMLLFYQRTYQFTHNDLHTNNVMFVATDLPYLYYSFNDTAYKVPTFGKIFKIIDFGRSIYTYKGNKYVSDSFSDEGDAATQYNTEPYFNASKPRIDANYSFDLCRLACSMVDVLPDTEAFADLNKLVDEWCTDDKGRNVVFKQNGAERYPNFKLYKMIARTVHEHTPEAQLRKPIFQQFIVKKKKLKNEKVMLIR
jgi:hypothetical protein